MDAKYNLASLASADLSVVPTPLNSPLQGRHQLFPDLGAAQELRTQTLNSRPTQLSTFPLRDSQLSTSLSH